jgi:hypothetical protein
MGTAPLAGRAGEAIAVVILVAVAARGVNQAAGQTWFLGSGMGVTDLALRARLAVPVVARFAVHSVTVDRGRRVEKVLRIARISGVIRSLIIDGMRIEGTLLPPWIAVNLTKSIAIAQSVAGKVLDSSIRTRINSVATQRHRPRVTLAEFGATKGNHCRFISKKFRGMILAMRTRKDSKQTAKKNSCRNGNRYKMKS